MSHPCPVSPSCGQCRYCQLWEDPVWRERWQAQQEGRELPPLETPAKVSAYVQPVAQEPCIHLGEPTGERRECDSCQGKVEIKLRACGVYGNCTTHKRIDGIACCVGCPRYLPIVLYRAS